MARCPLLSSVPWELLELELDTRVGLFHWAARWQQHQQIGVKIRLKVIHILFATFHEVKTSKPTSANHFACWITMEEPHFAASFLK